MKISPIVPLRERVSSLADGGLELIVLSTDSLVIGQQNAVVITEKDSIPAAKSGSVCSESCLF